MMVEESADVQVNGAAAAKAPAMTMAAAAQEPTPSAAAPFMVTEQPADRPPTSFHYLSC
jgi:hypothetical protein